jgi:uncharacterized protein
MIREPTGATGGIIHVRPDEEARRQARDDLVQFFATALKQ